MLVTTDRKVKAGFLLLTLIPVLLGIVIWTNTRQLNEASRDFAAATALVRRLETFLSRLKDVEVAQREYVLTGDESYVEELRRARADVESRLVHLSPRLAAAPWMALLQTLIPQKFDEIQKTVELRRSGDVAAASNVLLTNRGVQAMDDIRRVVRQMVEEENQLQSEAARVRDVKLRNTGLLSGTVLLLNIGLIWGLFVTIRRESRQAERANEELEARVQQRTLELRRSNEELQQFAYAASHDLKEPMRMLASYATLLERRYQGRLSEDADQWIHFIVDGVRRMNSLITSLLDYSRAGLVPEESKQEIEPSAVMGVVLENLRASIGETGARVTFDESMPRVMFEPVRMQQLLQNLVSNALKYRSEAAPVVHVSAREERGEVVFEVRDNGIGIAPQYQAEIFGIFKRLHGQEVEGTGIGLATCKRIVEEHGGRIWVESQPGEGSTFRFTVPVRRSAARAARR